MKKMLHAPTLELFCLVELPGADHQRHLLRSTLESWLRRWCMLQVQHPDHFVAVRETFWDAPQGYPMGILNEYMPLGSLDELIQACGGLPEEAMREIAQTVLEALDVLHSVEPPVVHGYLKPSQVLFGAGGRPKLAFGLEQRLRGSQAWTLQTPQDTAAAAASPGSELLARPSSEEQSTAVDIFDLGLLLLVSALGGFDVLLDAIPYAREFGTQPRRGPCAPLIAVSADTCSLLQCELRATGDLAAGGGSPAAGGGDMGYLPPASDLLFNRSYSEPFLAFVSTCLEAHTHSTPVSARDLLQHQFLCALAPVGPLVSLHEMQELARLLNEAPEHDPSRFGPAKSSRPAVPGVAPSAAQSAQLYLANIAQSIVPYHGSGGLPRGSRSRSLSDGDSASRATAAPGSLRPGHAEWETLITDAARTLGLPRNVVQQALEAQLERLLQSSARERRERSELSM